MWNWLVTKAKAIWVKVKPWAVPLGRTFLAFFAFSLVAELRKIDFQAFTIHDASLIVSIVVGAIGAGINALILGVQKILPGVPDPQPPAA